MKSKKTKNMARYLDPKSDLVFKRIFGEHPDLLIHFLNALMPFEHDRQIVELEYLSPELVPENPGKKNSIVDVRCIDNYKRQFIIEMQILWTDTFYNRIVFNAGKAYVRQLDKNENYDLLHPVYTLAILNDNFDHKTKNFYHHYQIVNKENTEEIIPGLEFVLVELTDKFHPENMAERRLAALWLRFLKEVDENMKTLPPEMQENEYIRKAAELCEEVAFTPAEMYAYDRYWDMVRVEKTIKSSFLREGLAKGEAIGRVKTLERIVVEGYRNGFSVEQIQTLTNHSIEQIIEILKRYGLNKTC
jgi:predicted transposase/invertase (TIGR01784 family)